MKLVQHLVLALGTALFAFNALAAPVEIHGVKLEDSAQVHGTQLQLNGAGTRYKFVIKVYVAGLYLAKKVSTPDEVINQPGAKRLSITMLRDVDANEFGKLLTRGIEDNMGKAAISKLIPGLLRMGKIFFDHKKLVAGDNFTIDWVPGSGTVITVKDVVQGEPFQEPEFFKALMMIWLGSSPADYKLKEALLGGK